MHAQYGQNAHKFGFIKFDLHQVDDISQIVTKKLKGVVDVSSISTTLLLNYHSASSPWP